MGPLMVQSKLFKLVQGMISIAGPTKTQKDSVESTLSFLFGNLCAGSPPRTPNHQKSPILVRAMCEQGGEQRQQQQRLPTPPRGDFQLSFHHFLKKEPEDPKG
eukprot:1138563-Pelagomonas_calceolata.AAC.6